MMRELTDHEQRIRERAKADGITKAAAAQRLEAEDRDNDTDTELDDE